MVKYFVETNVDWYGLEAETKISAEESRCKIWPSKKEVPVIFKVNFQIQNPF